MGTFFVCKDLTGQKFGSLTVKNRTLNSNDGHSVWVCVCDCGAITKAQSNNLKSGSVTSCGCKSKERVSKLNYSHGMTKTKEFKAWDAMLQRCFNPKNLSYKDYGGRGITVCDKWKNSFKDFFSDIGAAPAKNYSIERINVNGDYEPSNCKWATAKEQRANQRPRTYKSLTNG